MKVTMKLENGHSVKQTSDLMAAVRQVKGTLPVSFDVVTKKKVFMSLAPETTIEALVAILFEKGYDVMDAAVEIQPAGGEFELPVGQYSVRPGDEITFRTEGRDMIFEDEEERQADDQEPVEGIPLKPRRMSHMECEIFQDFRMAALVFLRRMGIKNGGIRVMVKDGKIQFKFMPKSALTPEEEARMEPMCMSKHEPTHKTEPKVEQNSK